MGACLQGAVEQAFPASSSEDKEAGGHAGADYLDCIVQALTLQSKTITEASAATTFLNKETCHVCEAGRGAR